MDNQICGIVEKLENKRQFLISIVIGYFICLFNNFKIHKLPISREENIF